MHTTTLLFIIWVVGCLFWIANQFHASNLRREYPGQIK